MGAKHSHPQITRRRPAATRALPPITTVDRTMCLTQVTTNMVAHESVLKIRYTNPVVHLYHFELSLYSIHSALPGHTSLRSHAAAHVEQHGPHG